MSVIRIFREENSIDKGWILDSAVLELEGKTLGRLWFRIAEIHKESLSDNLDHFVLGSLFRAMEEGANILAEGQVSPSLLRNLEEFTAAWAHWLPGKYRDISISAATECEPKNAGKSGAIAAFSGGVDAAFTAYRHHAGLAGRLTQKIEAGMLAHGFDIPLDQSEIFDNAFRNAKAMLKSLDLELIPVATNFREINPGFWAETHGAAIASCLLLLQKRYNTGLIGSTEPYRSLILPWGSNPITDPLLGNDSFEIIHDGAAFTRTAKVAVISSWPEALRHLRVCWQAENQERNCGVCEKCIRTILNFRLHGDNLPECFEKDVTDEELAALNGLNPVPLAYLQEILDSARKTGINEKWVVVLEKTIKRNLRSSRGWRKNLADARNSLALGTRMRRHFSGK